MAVGQQLHKLDSTRSGKRARLDEEGQYFTSKAFQSAEQLTETTGLHLDEGPSVPGSRIRGPRNRRMEVSEGEIEVDTLTCLFS